MVYIVDSIVVDMETETETKGNRELKHLGFVRISAIHALVCVSSLYNYAKRNSGSLRSTVSTVEDTVSAVVRPVYQKFKDVPEDLLVFLDAKVLVLLLCLSISLFILFYFYCFRFN